MWLLALILDHIKLWITWGKNRSLFYNLTHHSNPSNPIVQFDVFHQQLIFFRIERTHQTVSFCKNITSLKVRFQWKPTTTTDGPKKDKGFRWFFYPDVDKEKFHSMSGWHVYNLHSKLVCKITKIIIWSTDLHTSHTELLFVKKQSNLGIIKWKKIKTL